MNRRPHRVTRPGSRPASGPDDAGSRPGHPESQPGHRGSQPNHPGSQPDHPRSQPGHSGFQPAFFRTGSEPGLHSRSHPGRTLKPPKASRLEIQVGYWLLCASSQVSHALSHELWEMGVTLAEWLVLRELYDGDRRPSAVAAKFGLTRGALSRIAERLVTKLMITQEPIGDDGRGRMLALTAQGRAIVPILAAIADENDQEFFGNLDEATRGRFVAVLREVVRRRR